MRHPGRSCPGPNVRTAELLGTAKAPAGVGQDSRKPQNSLPGDRWLMNIEYPFLQANRLMLQVCLSHLVILRHAEYRWASLIHASILKATITLLHSN